MIDLKQLATEALRTAEKAAPVERWPPKAKLAATELKLAKAKEALYSMPGWRVERNQ